MGRFSAMLLPRKILNVSWFFSIEWHERWHLAGYVLGKSFEISFGAELPFILEEPLNVSESLVLAI